MPRQTRRSTERQPHKDTVLRRFADRVRSLREKCGWTQAELASRAKLRQHHVSHLESGRTMPTLMTVELLADAFDMELREFVDYPEQGTRETDRVADEIVVISRILRRLDLKTLGRVRRGLDAFAR
ncbi:MAG TPA: helix-turn-helix transcriptional regulator [Planctomycetota bacterium]